MRAEDNFVSYLSVNAGQHACVHGKPTGLEALAMSQKVLFVPAPHQS